MAPTPENAPTGLIFSELHPDDKICITGIAGSFPESDSVKHLGDNLFNKLDLITNDNRRWFPIPEVPHRTGKINNLLKFDATFFGINYKEALEMDSMQHIILEKAYECIIDAGYNPAELRNVKTGVFIGNSFSESGNATYYENLYTNEYGNTASIPGTLAPHISRYLGVTGPSYVVDTACSSSLTAFENAVKAIRNGNCEAAFVGGANLVLHSDVSDTFARLGVLCPDGSCKCFDNKANGYVRSEAISVCFLQKAKDARRIYAEVVHAKTNCDGYKEQGITYPSGLVQKLLLDDFYKECGISPATVEYVEAHGTGTKVGDPEELTAIDQVFCAGRSEPLLIGSVKSNLGHCEGASGMSSLAKLCIAYHTGFIPPNINYSTPREGVEGLIEKRLEVVTEKRPWRRGLAAVSSFGFGGANVHSLLRNISKSKVNNGLPDDDLPRLVCISGRTESSVATVLDDLESRTVDVDEVRLWHAIHNQDITHHHFRGYTLLGSTPKKSISLGRSIQRFSGIGRPVYFLYSGLGAQWPAMANQLMKLPAFAASIQKCHKILEPKGIDLAKIITEPNQALDNILHSFIAVASVQIGLTDILKAVEIKPNHIIGHDFGELGCAYADGCLSAEQTILAAFSIGQAFVEAKLTNQVNSSDIALCLRNITDVAPTILKSLKGVIQSPKIRSEKWISGSALKTSLRETANSKLVSAEYLTNSLLRPALFEETSRIIPSNAIIIELAPHGLLQDSLLHSLPKKVTYVTLGHKHETSAELLLTALGKLFEAGVNPHLANIYPHVPFPVSQGTPTLANLVEWDHSEDWLQPDFKKNKTILVNERLVRITLKIETLEYLQGHCIDGRILYPATGYLVLAWETLAMINDCHQSDMSVVFENVSFHRATTLPTDGGVVEFVISIHKKSGNFEIVENSVSVVTGRIYAKQGVGKEFREIPNEPEVETDIMHAKDFYKELNLRGYQYKDLFRGVLGCNVEGTRGRLKWDNNWVTLLDTMLQPKIVTHDTRSLYVPTRIERIAIDVDIHNELISREQSFTQKSFEYRLYPHIGVTRVGGVELRGLHVTAIAKKPPRGIAVFEKNEFIPNYSSSIMTVEDILRADLQLVFENIGVYKFKCIELVDEEYDNNGFEPVIQKVGDVLADLPLVQAELLVISKEELQMPPNITVANKKVAGEQNTMVFIGANLYNRPDVLQEGFLTLKDQCFVLSRELNPPEPKDYSEHYDLVTIHKTESEYFVLMRKKLNSKSIKYVKIVTADQTFSWIDTVKKIMEDAQKLVLYSQGESINGLLGLVNCLRREPGGEIVSGLLIDDPMAPKFDPELKMYKEQLSKGLAMNVFKDGKWGTYRHLLLEDLETVPSPHAYVNTTTAGDISSLRWLQGALGNDSVNTNLDNQLVHVYCSALNFRDVMTAMGRVTLDAVARGRIAQECVQGIEVSGRTANGCRVMAVAEKAISNLVLSDSSVMWAIPDEWSFEEAASVPVAYCTVYMALVMIGKIHRGESILIHAGSGGVGQAAINVAQHHGLEVFTTVGTPAKRKIIKQLFPQLKDSHIGNSRDTSFLEMIQRETNGRGVDLVLNSLADDKLLASVACLARRGRFLEIGKYDITNNTLIETCFLKKEISFHGVMLDFINDECSFKLRKTLQQLLLKGINSGAVRPLTYCTFEKNSVETAYRYMASGKHIGKVIIKIRESEPSEEIVKPSPMYIDALQRYTCNADRVYVLVGGLGGFGLELTDWLVLRGARKVVLTSRKGVSNGYQAMRLKIWASYGADIKVSTHDVTTESGCEETLKLASSMGPVEAIFNLAVVLKDAIFQNQTAETFKTSFEPKALATIHLDKLSRKLCPKLKDFVIFSSVSCGRGNAGQTNYGFSNSVMERICEERKKAGLPALAIQWGAIGDVGLVADMQEENIQLEIGGTLQQRIVSCLQAMDKFLKQNKAAIVSSIVVAEKRSGSSENGTSAEAIANILGIKDLKTVSHQAALAELGMDSIMAVEIKQTLERDFEIFLNAQEIRTLTFGKLIEIDAARVSDSQAVEPRQVDDVASAGIEIFMTNFGDEKLAAEPFINMPTRISDGKNDMTNQETNPIMFLLPGVESCASALKTLCSYLNIRACVLQLGNNNRGDTLEAMTSRLLATVKSKLAPGAPFYLLGYSFGSIPILNLAAKLESEGHKGVVFCIDGSPDFLRAFATLSFKLGDDESLLENALIKQSLKLTLKNNTIIDGIMEKVKKCDTLDEKASCASQLIPVEVKYSSNFITEISNATYDRIKVIMLHSSEQNLKTIKSPIVLLRPKLTPPNMVCSDDYGLHKFTESNVEVHYLDADHVSIVANENCANIINKVLADTSVEQTDKTRPNVITNMIDEPSRAKKRVEV